MSESLSITCPLCKMVLGVPAEPVGETQDGRLIVHLDRSETDKHLTECAKRVPVAPPMKQSTALERPAMNLPKFVAAGVRACNGCGESSGECFRSLHQGQKGGPSTTGKHRAVGCCAMCDSGNTHPAPGADMSCAHWGVEHGTKD